MDMKAKIFLIEDDREIAELLISYLKDAGYEVFWEENGRNALYKISQQDFSPDIIILDFFLPGMNGDKIARFLKFNDKTMHIPIILLTSRVIADTMKKLEYLNIDFLLFKPFSLEQLDEVIKNYLKKNGSKVS